MGKRKSPSQSSQKKKKRKKHHRDFSEEEYIAETQSQPINGDIEAGIIKKIRLEFNPCINFITGANGSGKSAILTAIQVCLGAKSSATHRGAKIKDLIKTGEDFAQVTLWLRNEGRDAYKPEEYGDTIIVERRIDKHSGSNYKLKDSSGKKIFSRSYRELKLILDQFNIQVNNPCTIMTQDVSRNFLASSKAEKKYKFFLEATQLSKMMDEFGYINHNKESIEKILKLKMDAMEEKKQLLQKLRQEYDDASQLVELQKQLDVIRDKMVWAIVKEKEQEVEMWDGKIQREKEKLAEYEKRIAKAKDGYQQYESKRLELTSKVDALTSKIKQKQLEVHDIDKQIHAVQKRISSVKSNIQDKRQRIKNNERAIAEAKKNIKQIEEKAQRDKSAEKKRKDDAIAAKRKQVDEIKEDMKKNDEEIKNLEKQRNENAEKLEHLNQQKRELEQNRKRAVQEQRSLKLQQTDKLKYFGDATAALLKEIQKHISKFHKPPIGPIGLMITPKDLGWGAAIEASLKNALNWFIVHDYNDEKTLKNICRSLRIKPPAMIIYKHVTGLYDIDKPDKSFVTIFDTLNIDSRSVKSNPVKVDINTLKPTILNVLIDHLMIERKILIKDVKTAVDVMFKGGKSPAKVSECFTANGSRLFKRGQSEVVLNNDVRTKLFCANYEQRIAELEQNIKKYDNEMNSLKTEIDSVSKQGREILKQLDALKTKQKKNQRLKFQLETDIENILNEPVEEEEDTKSMIENWQRTIAERESEIKQYESQISESSTASQGIAEELKQLKNKRKEKDEEKQQLIAESQALQEELREIIKQQGMFNSKKQTTERYIEKHKNNIELLIGKKKQYEAELEDATRNAKVVCPNRIEPELKSTDYESQRTTLQMRLRKESQRFGRRSVEEIKKRYLEEQQIQTQIQKFIEIAQSNLKIIKDGLLQRLQKWKTIRLEYARITSQWFNKYLSQKGHTGSLNFDHDSETLDLSIQLESQRPKENSVTVEDVKSLSGGERSFSTVSFLLALWEVVESPFRAMDEFDIFMDAVYRKKALDLLVSVALEKHKNKQLIVITPHNVSDVRVPGEHKERVKFVRLKDPQRSGQQQIENYIRPQQN